MDGMSRLLTFRRETSWPAQHVRGPLRTREPAGIIDADDATDRLARLRGAEIGAADISMDRLVVAIQAQPLHLLVVAGPITLTSGDGAVSVSHAAGSPDALAALGPWSGRRVAGVRVRGNGALEIATPGGTLTVPADPDHEAWEVRGMDGGLIACLPGGQISLWRPTAGQVASAEAGASR